MKIEKKSKIVEELHQRLKKSKVVIVTDYKGMDVESMNQLRNKLREAGIEYQVVKNTLLSRACQDTEVSVLQNEFKGPSGIAISYDDPVAPAKVLTEFIKENKKLEIRFGAMAGKMLKLEDVQALSSLPCRDALLAKVLSALIAVPTSFVRVLNGIPQQFLNVLTAVKEQKEGV